MVHDFQPDIDAVQALDVVPKILEIVCNMTGMGFAAVARVTEHRWIACGVLDHVRFGLTPGAELEIESTICHEIRQHRQPVVIEDVALDETYCAHHTPATYGLQSYISMPIVLSDGTFFGTLCAIDAKPRALNTPTVIETFRLFANLIAFHLEAQRRLALSEARLAAEMEMSALREQFVAVLGHDLRNPLTSINAVAELLLREELSPRATRMIGLMRNSVVRMDVMIGNVMDFARGRLGGGFALAVGTAVDVGPVLEQVISELAVGQGRDIEARLGTDLAVDCDPGRVGQLFSNLLGNALTHGASDRPIRVTGACKEGVFTLAVSNGGAAIPPAAKARLFQPYVRGESPSQSGLGLGLFIASEIARAHRGTIDVHSDEAETRFTFRMPVKATAV